MSSEKSSFLPWTLIKIGLPVGWCIIASLSSSAVVVPNDPLYPDQWAHDNQGQSPIGGLPDCDLDTPTAWEMTTGSTDVVVAILSSGVDLDHPDLQSRLVPGYDFIHAPTDTVPDDSYGEGTALAGIVAAVANNARLVSGADFACKVMPIQTQKNGQTGCALISEGIRYAAEHGADVILLEDILVNPGPLCPEAVEYAINVWGVPVVAAFWQVTLGLQYDERVVFVRGYEPTCPTYSEFGRDPHDESGISRSGIHDQFVKAPGEYIVTTDIVGVEGLSSLDYVVDFDIPAAGAAYVAGVIALMKSVNPTLTPSEIHSIIMETAIDMGEPGPDVWWGQGRVHAPSAIAAASGVVVDCSAPLGGGGTWFDPYGDIDAGLSAVPAGDILYLKSSNCAGYHLIDQPVTIKSVLGPSQIGSP